MTDAPIPHFPVVHGNIYPDGTAHINFAGHDVPLTPANIADARAQITSYAVAVARDILHRPVRLTTVDPDGQWTLAAHPDGRVTDLAPAARPAKRPRWRRPTVSGPSSAPATGRTAVGSAAADGRTAPVRPLSEPAPVASVTEPAAPLPVMPTVPATVRADSTPAWTVSDLPSEAELTVFIERHQPVAPMLGLRFSTGASVQITGAALVGRRPVNTTGAELDVHQVDDPSRNLSRTHFVIAWSDHVPAIIDQRSGNGTTIERGDVDLVAVPGVAIPLQDGDRLRFGDLTCEVTVAAEREVTP
jgi:predicted component of type VI protein secretion system